jgi:Fe2+ or Zn2+ uptake regulation protein
MVPAVIDIFFLLLHSCIEFSGHSLHHHLICLRCDAVIDTSDAALDALPIPDPSDFDFEVRDFRVQLRGICRRCRRKRKEE